MFPGTFEGATLGCSTWSPDGGRLAVEGFNDNDHSRNGIYLADAHDGGNIVRLTTNGQDSTDVPGDWSPDGRQVAFVRGIAGQENGTLWVVDVDSGNARRVIPNLVGIAVGWSPDGQWLVADRALVAGQASSFILVRPDGSDLRTISLPANHNWATGPTFSPDGTRLAFNMAVGTADKADIYTMKIDGWRSSRSRTRRTTTSTSSIGGSIRGRPLSPAERHVESGAWGAAFQKSRYRQFDVEGSRCEKR